MKGVRVKILSIGALSLGVILLAGVSILYFKDLRVWIMMRTYNREGYSDKVVWFSHFDSLGPQYVPCLMRYLKSDVLLDRRAASLMLARIGNRSCIPCMIECCEHEAEPREKAFRADDIRRLCLKEGVKVDGRFLVIVRELLLGHTNFEASVAADCFEILDVDDEWKKQLALSYIRREHLSVTDKSLVVKKGAMWRFLRDPDSKCALHQQLETEDRLKERVGAQGTVAGSEAEKKAKDGAADVNK